LTILAITQNKTIYKSSLYDNYFYHLKHYAFRHGACAELDVLNGEFCLFFKTKFNMKFWDNLITAEIIRTENELKIEVILVWKFHLLNFSILVFSFFMGVLFPESGVAIISFMVSLVLFWLMSNKLGSVQKANSASFSIHKNQEKILGKTNVGDSIIMSKPYFIDIFVLPIIEKSRFKIVLENKGMLIGFYTLKNGEDLTKLIDGFTELLDLELYENNKLSDGEVLSFKSKNHAIEPYSGLWIRTPNNKLMISSLPNTSNWIELDLSQQILKNRTKQFELKEIEKIVIQDGYFGKMNVDIITKKGKTKTIFKHQVSEITMIRDKKRLLETLRSQAILGDIEIEVA
jgi:hypothetical protein